ncbi:MAG: hypothetical protein AMK69_21340 [Nitrospira bacterium SG8_3]|nr:MAG: hypothetical protein AMK69_21340 [Nitrospira bacterium SG8_3]
MAGHRLDTIEWEVLRKRIEGTSTNQQAPTTERINTYPHKTVQIHEQNAATINDLIKHAPCFENICGEEPDGSLRVSFSSSGTLKEECCRGPVLSGVSAGTKREAHLEKAWAFLNPLVELMPTFLIGLIRKGFF